MAIDKGILFSGGRDSCVLLHILEPWLDECLVMWCNTGAAYESTLEQMRAVRKSVPHFLEVRTDQPKDVAKYGYPTDIVPARHDHQIGGYLEPKLQSTFSCCAKNIWIPLQLAARDNGLTALYYGSREEEDMKDARWDRKDNNGIDHNFPMRKWTKQMLQDYIDKHTIAIPAYYAEGEEKSRDCWSCTGYLWERKNSINNLVYTDKLEVKHRLDEIYVAIYNEVQIMKPVMDAD